MDRFSWHLFPAMALLAACLGEAKSSDLPVMCESSDECSGTAVCDKGVCWGDPPDTHALTAVLIPPADRPDLAPTELTSIAISADGYIADLRFGQAVLLHGRIILGCADEQTEGCGADAPVPAQVHVERASGFLGGPLYRRSVLTNIGLAPEKDTFSISLPADGAEYRVTVIPDEAVLDSRASGGVQIQVPPFSTTVRTSGDLAVVWEVGKPEQLKSIEGCITSATGNGANFKGMHVSALGRWTAEAKATRASSVVTTNSEGCYRLKVPIDMLDTFDIIAKPPPGKSLPTLRLVGEIVPDPALETPWQVHVIAPLLMPNAANPVRFKLPLRGASGGGALEPVSGATVVFDTVFELPVPDERNIEVSFSTQAVSNPLGQSEPGVAVVDLYPGSADRNRHYTVRVLSPPDSENASVFDAHVEIGTGEGAPVLGNLDLTRRVAVTGSFTTAAGEPLANTPLTVRPASLLRLETTAAERALLDNLQFPSTLSEKAGDFLVWLDPALLGIMARYDFELAPSDFSSAPRWTFENLGLEGTASVDFGEMTLPPASHARGSVTDANGKLVAGAEIRWFQGPSQEVCNASRIGGRSDTCLAPARLLGIWESDKAGETIVVLPDP